MSKFLTVATIFALSSSAFAAENASEARACIAKNILAFGSSVTMGTPALVPGYATFVTGLEVYQGSQTNTDGSLEPLNRNFQVRPYGLSPVLNLAHDLLGPGLSALRHVTFTGHYVPSELKHGGSAQIASMLTGRRASQFAAASMVIGVDAFYWDAVWRNCGAHGAPGQIPRLIEAAKSAGKVVVLGTVPNEDPSHVKIDLALKSGKGLWFKPDEDCAAQINAAIWKSCTYESNCYVVDLAKAAASLNAGLKLPLHDGREFTLYEMRPDGVHMSDVGNQYIAELLEDQFAEHPPTCVSPSK